MERITSHQVVGLMEAYGAVYTPQELSEEQVWEGVETWVNFLVEEGRDLSDWTWEEMYEAYVDQLNEGAADAGAAVRKGIGGAVKGYADIVGSQLKGLAGQTTTSSNPLSRAGNAVTRAVSSLPRAGASFAKGLVTGQGDTPAKPKMPGLPPSAKKVTQYPQGVSTGVGGGNAGASRQAPAARPAAAAPAAARPSVPAARPSTPTTATKPAPTATKPSAATTGNPPLKPPALPPVPGRESLASQAAELRAMQAASRQRQGLTQSFDVFDVIKGHLIDEGYADTEEAALKIMANMSEEWKESIVEGYQEPKFGKKDYIKKLSKRGGMGM